MRRFIQLLVPIAVVIAKGSYYYYNPPIEKEHAAEMYTTARSRMINGSDSLVADPLTSPDFRIEEPPFLRHYHYFMQEEERPYRISPAYKQLSRWYSRDNPTMLGCACTTVFKRTHVLAGCAVLTMRHIITTATSTELIIKNRRKLKAILFSAPMEHHKNREYGGISISFFFLLTLLIHIVRLTNILGVWYDVDVNRFNSSFYNTPSRIHYHPRYIRPKAVNRSHPLPAVMDLAVWTMIFNFYGSTGWLANAYICPRGGSHWLQYGSSVPAPDELAILVGFQFIRAFRRKPMPWFKYAVRTRKHIQPCPKVEWGWFHCIRGNWAKLGMDSGASMFRALHGRGWRYDGLIGLNAVSMILRSLDMIHYFTVLDTHLVLDFLYAAYTGKIKYEYLDKRFLDTTNRSPRTLSFSIRPFYDVGHEHYYGMDLPNYK